MSSWLQRDACPSSSDKAPCPLLQAAFALPHVQAAAAVAATRPAEQGLKDLLVLHMPASRLALYVGQRLVCNLLLPAGSLRGLTMATGQWPSAVPTSESIAAATCASRASAV